MEDAAIDVSGLVKTFGSFRALDELDLQVATGKVHGLSRAERRRQVDDHPRPARAAARRLRPRAAARRGPVARRRRAAPPARLRACALFFIDLDGFKPVNDDHGHEIGDKLLIAVGERLRGYARG